MKLPFKLSLYLAEHKLSQRIEMYQGKDGLLSDQLISVAGAEIQIGADIADLGEGIYDVSINVCAVKGRADSIAMGLCLDDTNWSTQNYVLIPGAVYNGNRFTVERHAYPPPFHGPKPFQNRKDLKTIDLPRLNKEAGPSHLNQLSIDAATPGMGVYFPEREGGLFIFSEQLANSYPFNYEIIENADRSRASLMVGVPGVRHGKNFVIRYHQPSGFAETSDSRGLDLVEGDTFSFSFRIHWFKCQSRQDLFDHLFKNRETCFNNKPLRKEIPYSEVMRIISTKQNRLNWRESMSLYQTGILGKAKVPPPTLLFQSGWTGGMIVTYPLLQQGDPISVKRVLRHLEFVFTGLSPAGFFYPFFDGKNWTCRSGTYFGGEDPPWTLTRKVGDILYFLLRHLVLLKDRGQQASIKRHWEQSLLANAEAVLKVWREYHDLGQYINVRTGELEIAGSTSGALIPAALVLAAEYFKEERFLSAAEDMAEFYRINDLADGLHTGGPGDAMQAPDSESIVQLIESFILLYETKGDSRWRQAAQDACIQAASWSLSYDYQFPKGTALAEIKAQTQGVWIANAQNKTGVPGVCTLSGQGFLRTYRATGDVRLLEILKKATHVIPQYMGRKDKEIPCSYSGGNPHETMPEGWICERVNITQWGEPIGELFAYSTWCEVAMMLACVDLPGVYVQVDRGLVVDFDHINAHLETERDNKKVLYLSNPTNFPAEVRILVEDDDSMRKPLGINAAANWPLVRIPAGKEIRWELETDSLD